MGEGTNTGSVERIGAHRILCGDVMLGDVGRLMAGDRADILYTDPPWGPGMLTFFATAREKGSAPRGPWAEFVRAWADAIDTSTAPHAPLFVEMGNRWVADFEDALARIGRPVRQRWTVHYGSGSKLRPSTLLLAGPELPLDAAFDPTPLRSAALPRACVAEALRALRTSGALAPADRALVLDPCCGLGLTARAAVAAGITFAGLELVPARLADTRLILERAVSP